MVVSLLEFEEEPGEAVVGIEAYGTINVKLDMPAVTVFRPELQEAMDAATFSGMNKKIQAIKIVLFPFCLIDLLNSIFPVHAATFLPPPTAFR